MAANRARQPPPGLRGNAYPEAINRTLVFFGVTYTPVFANIAMEIPPFLDVNSIGKKLVDFFNFHCYGYVLLVRVHQIQKKKTNKKSQNRTPQVGG